MSEDRVSYDPGHLQKIPLSLLKISPLNARKTGGASIEDLAGSIAAHGLKQNLCVTKADKHYLVVAGSRRLAALQLLAKNGQLKDDHPVNCLVVPEADAAEISLAENVVRQAMHPADEFEAFRALAKTGLATGEIATRFGTSEKHVEQRLRLANVAPQILAEYRAGDATLEQMMALAIVDDHSAQMKAWKPGSSHGKNEWFRSPDNLRKALVDRDVSLTSSLGKFVGLEAYKAAGGVPRTDLFSDFATLPDSKLVNKIALAKLEEKAVALRKQGWGWVETRISFDYSEKSKYSQQHGAAASDKLGVIVCVDQYNGQAEIHKGLVKPGAKAPTAKKAAAAKPKAGSGSREFNDKLHGVRTAILRSHLRDGPYLALAALAAAIATNVFRGKWDDPSPSVIVLDAQPFIPSAVAQAINKTDPQGAKAHAAWAAKVAAGAKKHGSILAWLVNTDEAVAVDLLAFMATELLLADDTDEADVHKFAKAVDVSFAGSWAPTTDWLGQQSAPFVLAAVAEACGKDKAKLLEKLKGKAIAVAAAPLLTAAGWMPELLRGPAPPKPAPKKIPAKKAKAPK